MTFIDAPPRALAILALATVAAAFAAGFLVGHSACAFPAIPSFELRIGP